MANPPSGAVRPTDLHRVYIQSLLSRRAMTDDVALEMYKRAVGACLELDAEFISPHRTNLEGLASFLEEVSTLLEPVGMVVKRGREDTSAGRGWVVLCNTDAGEVAQTATDLSPLELSFYRAVLEGIVTSYPANSIGSAHALRLTQDLQGAMTRTAGEAVLTALVGRGWLQKSKRGRYSLAPRAMFELEHYLREEYAEYVNKCRRCDKTMWAGFACGNEECQAHYHPYCYNAISRSNRPQCVVCRESFNEYAARPVGEKSVRPEEDDWVRARGKRRRQTQGGDEEEEEEEDDELEDEEGASLEERMVDAPGSQMSQDVTQDSQPRRRRNASSQSQSQSQPQSQAQSRTQSRAQSRNQSRAQSRSQSPIKRASRRSRQDAHDDEPGPSRRSSRRQEQETVIPDSFVDDDE